MREDHRRATVPSQRSRTIGEGHLVAAEMESNKLALLCRVKSVRPTNTPVVMSNAWSTITVSEKAVTMPRLKASIRVKSARRAKFVGWLWRFQYSKPRTTRVPKRDTYKVHTLRRFEYTKKGLERALTCAQPKRWLSRIERVYRLQ
jgi:hypothetical protein